MSTIDASRDQREADPRLEERDPSYSRSIRRSFVRLYRAIRIGGATSSDHAGPRRGGGAVGVLRCDPPAVVVDRLPDYPDDRSAVLAPGNRRCLSGRSPDCSGGDCSLSWLALDSWSLRSAGSWSASNSACSASWIPLRHRTQVSQCYSKAPEPSSSALSVPFLCLMRSAGHRSETPTGPDQWGRRGSSSGISPGFW